MTACYGRAADRQVRADDAVGGVAGRDRRAPHHLRGVRPPAARGPPVRRGGGHRPVPGALPEFVFDDAACESLSSFPRRATLDYLRGFRFGGDIDGYAEGELYFPGSPVLSVTGTFAECVVLETLALSIFNHDTAIASAAARMVSAAAGRPLIEMGSRRTHEQAAVAAARAAYIAGFAGTSNLEARPATACPLWAPARMRSRCCTPPDGARTSDSPRSGPRSTRWGSAPRCWSTPTT